MEARQYGVALKAVTAKLRLLGLDRARRPQPHPIETTNPADEWNEPATIAIRPDEEAQDHSPSRPVPPGPALPAVPPLPPARPAAAAATPGRSDAPPRNVTQTRGAPPIARSRSSANADLR